MREVGRIEKISQHDHGNNTAVTTNGLPAPFAAQKTTVLVSFSEILNERFYRKTKGFVDKRFKIC